MTTETRIVRVPFHGDELEAIKVGEEVRVVIKRTCENVGLDYSSQLQVLKKARWARVVMIATTGNDGKTYEMATVPLKALPMWMANINPNKVKPEIRLKLELYQDEAADALANHFFGTAKQETQSYESFVRMFMTVAMPSMASTIATTVTSAMSGMFRQFQDKKLDEGTIGRGGAAIIKRALKEYSELMAPCDKKMRRSIRSGEEMDLRVAIGHVGTGRTLEQIPCDKWEQVKPILEELKRKAERMGKSKQMSLFS
jgi:hypothetical protein